MLINGDVTRIELDEGKPFKDVIAEVNLYLKSIGITHELFGEVTGWEEHPILGAMPERWQWIACYPVKGSSEGYYIHIDILFHNGTRTMFGLAKVWDWESACLRANAAAKILNDV